MVHNLPSWGGAPDKEIQGIDEVPVWIYGVSSPLGPQTVRAFDGKKSPSVGVVVAMSGPCRKPKSHSWNRKVNGLSFSAE
jgi:hypothetical protein